MENVIKILEDKGYHRKGLLNSYVRRDSSKVRSLLDYSNNDLLDFYIKLIKKESL